MSLYDEALIASLTPEQRAAFDRLAAEWGRGFALTVLELAQSMADDDRIRALLEQKQKGDDNAR